MSSHSLSPATKGLLICVVASVQAALLVALSVNARDPEHTIGGAPVINLSIQPVVAFDSEGDTHDDFEIREKITEVGPATPSKITPRLSARVDVSPELSVLPVEAQSPGSMMAAVALEGDAGALTGSPIRESGPRASASSHPGMTRGGGGQAIGASGGLSTDNYEAEVLKWIERHKGAAGGNLGVVTVGFTLDARGRLRREWIVASSGRSALDILTLRRLREAAPFPRPPAGITWRTRDFVVNIDYRVRT